MFLPSVSLSIVILPSIFRVCDFTLSFFFQNEATVYSTLDAC
jgi:hypothetical protein